MCDVAVWLTCPKLGTAFDGTVAVPFRVYVWTAVCGSVFSEFMGLAVIAVGAGHQFQAVVVKIIDISIDLHNPALKFAGVGRIIPGTVLLDPAGSHDLVGAKEEPVVLVINPVVGTVISGTPLIFHTL